MGPEPRPINNPTSKLPRWRHDQNTMKLTNKITKPLEAILENETATIDQQLQALSILRDLWTADVRMKIERDEIMDHLRKKKKPAPAAVSQASAQVKALLAKVKNEQ